jgi:hypothetical protein
MEITDEQAAKCLSIVQRIAKAQGELEKACGELEGELGQAFINMTGGSAQYLDTENWKTIEVVDAKLWIEDLEEDG